MLPGQGVIRAELGEDRDHHPAELVLPVRVRFGRERPLQGLERLIRIAVVPGGEGALELVRPGTVIR